MILLLKHLDIEHRTDQRVSVVYRECLQMEPLYISSLWLHNMEQKFQKLMKLARSSVATGFYTSFCEELAFTKIKFDK